MEAYAPIIEVINSLLLMEETRSHGVSYLTTYHDRLSKNISRDEIRRYLDLLHKKGCIAEPLGNSVWVSKDTPLILTVHLERLIAYRKELISPEERRFEQAPARSATEKISSIELVITPEEKKEYLVVLNKKYNKVIELNKKKNSTMLLHDLATCQHVDKTPRNLKAMEYLNARKDCQLYSKTGYVPTIVVKQRSGYIVPAVKIRKLAMATYKKKSKT